MALSTSARPPMTEDEARKQVKKEKAFYGSLATYVVTMSMLAALNLFTGGYLWFIWPLFGWGIGIVSQAVGAFGMPGMGGWEEKRVQALAGQQVSEARLRRMLDEELDERAVPAGAPQSTDRLQRRIEHLEAIVTSRDWDAAASLPDVEAPRGATLRTEAPLASHFGDGERGDDALDLDETPAEQAARIARRVR